MKISFLIFGLYAGLRSVHREHSLMVQQSCMVPLGTLYQSCIVAWAQRVKRPTFRNLCNYWVVLSLVQLKGMISLNNSLLEISHTNCWVSKNFTCEVWGVQGSWMGKSEFRTVLSSQFSTHLSRFCAGKIAWHTRSGISCMGPWGELGIWLWLCPVR